MVNTKIKPIMFNIDALTPQAQKLDDVLSNDIAKHRSSTASSLERMSCHPSPAGSVWSDEYLAVIPETREVEGDDDYDDGDDFAIPALSQDSEVKACLLYTSPSPRDS